MSDVEHQLDLQIRLTGSLGSPAAEMKVIGEFDRLQVVRFDQVAAALPGLLVELIVDLKETTIIDSSALGALVRLRRELDRIDAGLSVVIDKPFQVTVMKVGGLFDYLGVIVEASEHTSEPSSAG